MMKKMLLKTLEQGLQCPVCKDVFQEPVLLRCSHTFCRQCVQRCWELGAPGVCPECRSLSNTHQEPPTCNRAIQRLCEAFHLQLQEEEGGVRGSSDSGALLCSAHSELLELFCLEDQKLVCRACVEEHQEHHCSPAQDAVCSLKDALRAGLQPLQEKLDLLRAEKLSWSLRAKLLKEQAERAESELRRELEELHLFLQKEEERRLTRLREEEQQKMEVLEQQLHSLGRSLLDVEESVRRREELIRSSDATFLMLHLQKIEHSVPSPQNPRWSQEEEEEEEERTPGELQMDVARHLGNLKNRLWERMRRAAPHFPVVLDPSSAHPCLHLTGSLSTLRFCPHPPRPLLFAPEADESCPSVLGSVSFSAGVHLWDVEVSRNTCWALGVITESAIRARVDPPTAGLWLLGFVNGKLGQRQSGEYLTPLSLQREVHRIRVLLDWDRGKLSFLDAITDTVLHSFSERFQERLRPYFCSACPSQTLRILPLE